jgi:hypothetical protein
MGEELFLDSLTTWDLYEARTFNVSAIAWNTLIFKNAHEKFVNEVHTGIADKTKIMPMKVVAAEQHLWSLGIPELKLVADKASITLKQQCSLADALVVMTTSALTCTDAHALNLHKPRLKQSKHPDTAVVEELFEMDEAAKCFSEDGEEVTKEQIQHRETQDRTFCVMDMDLKDKNKRVRDRTQADGPLAKKNRKSHAHLVLLPGDEFTFASMAANAFLPPRAFVWRDIRTNSWRARLDPQFSTHTHVHSASHGQAQVAQEQLSDGCSCVFGWIIAGQRALHCQRALCGSVALLV